MRERVQMPSSRATSSRPSLTLRMASASALLLLVAFSLVLGGCQKDPGERTLERYDALVRLLEHNMQDSERLLLELESFVDQHKGEWTEDREAFEALDENPRTRISSKYDQPTRETLQRLLEVSAQVQDRLRDEPEQLARYLALMNSIGMD